MERIDVANRYIEENFGGGQGPPGALEPKKKKKKNIRMVIPLYLYIDLLTTKYSHIWTWGQQSINSYRHRFFCVKEHFNSAVRYFNDFWIRNLYHNKLSILLNIINTLMWCLYNYFYLAYFLHLAICLFVFFCQGYTSMFKTHVNRLVYSREIKMKIVMTKESFKRKILCNSWEES